MDTQDLDLRLHLFAQGALDAAQAMRWFESITEAERRDVLRRLVLLGLQAGLVPSDGRVAVDRSGMRCTLAPAVLVRQEGDYIRHLMEMSTLAVRELGAAFQLLLSALAVADERRRSRECRGACTHAWHRLPAPDVQVVDLRDSVSVGVLAAAGGAADSGVAGESRPAFPVPAEPLRAETADASHRRGRRSVTVATHPRHALAAPRLRRH